MEAYEDRWSMTRLVAVQPYYAADGEELGLDLRIISGDIFRVSVPREYLKDLRDLIEEAEAILDRKARPDGTGG
jgi:hypothetical protein